MNNTKDYRQDRQTTKVSKRTLELLRVVAALNGETMIDAMERLVEAEYERVTREFQAKLDK